MQVKMVTVSSMDKVFLDGAPQYLESSSSVFRNERASFGVCVYSEQRYLEPSITAESALKDSLSIRIVEHVPCELAAAGEYDDYYLTTKSGLFPDVLRPNGQRTLTFPEKKWVSAIVTVETDGSVLPGTYEITLYARDREGEKLAECKYSLTVLDEVLPPSDLTITHWVHYDSIAHKHNVQLFTDEFYVIFEKYLARYTAMGSNMLMTPVITPALDTKIGHERLTAQLVLITYKKDKFTFDFSELKKFLDFVRARGIEYLEIPPMFTQWGAKSCPKIMATTENGYERIFGWDTDSTDEKYAAFLAAFLPALTDFLRAEGMGEKTYFHISDEPSLEVLDHFEKVRPLVADHIKGFKIFDALSKIDFYERGLVDVPVVAIDFTQPFADKNVDYWVYYCCGQVSKYVSNRFLSMPSQRNRILGFQLYKNDIHGFLQWGFNFYNSVHSIEEIDPYRTTDAIGAFPGGDAFVVYPNGDEVLESLRGVVFTDAIHDYRALKLLEKYKGREFVLKMLENEGIEGFSVYPRCADWHREFRQKINALIMECKK